jgi:hypothetical protein
LRNTNGLVDNDLRVVIIITIPINTNHTNLANLMDSYGNAINQLTINGCTNHPLNGRFVIGLPTLMSIPMIIT